MAGVQPGREVATEGWFIPSPTRMAGRIDRSTVIKRHPTKSAA